MPRDRTTTRRVADALYRHTRQAAQASGLPVLEVNDAHQRGDTFGARLANAFADAFAAGYEHVIAVGSDCPRLHEVDWTVVTAHLAAGTPVLGPTADAGGAYLIGLRRAQFDRSAFEALPWRSPALLPALRRHLAACAAPPALLPARADVNSAHDLQALLRASAAPPPILMARLRWALGYTVVPPPPIEPLKGTACAGTPSSRAPPRAGPTSLS